MIGQLPHGWMQVLKVTPKPVRSEVDSDTDDVLRTIAPVQYVHDLAGLVCNSRGYVSCPGHEDWKPSLKVYDTAEDGWYCYQCERGGSIYDFAALAGGLGKDWGT